MRAVLLNSALGVHRLAAFTDTPRIVVDLHQVAKLGGRRLRRIRLDIQLTMFSPCSLANAM